MTGKSGSYEEPDVLSGSEHRISIEVKTISSMQQRSSKYCRLQRRKHLAERLFEADQK